MSADNLPDKSQNLSSYTYHGMLELGKIWVTFGKVWTKITENIFLKYLLQYLHEIARKYPREKKYSSSFYDSVISNT